MYKLIFFDKKIFKQVEVYNMDFESTIKSKVHVMFSLVFERSRSFAEILGDFHSKYYYISFKKPYFYAHFCAKMVILCHKSLPVKYS